jgi:hypothetical protein
MLSRRRDPPLLSVRLERMARSPQADSLTRATVYGEMGPPVTFKIHTPPPDSAFDKALEDSSGRDLAFPDDSSKRHLEVSRAFQRKVFCNL